MSKEEAEARFKALLEAGGEPPHGLLAGGWHGHEFEEDPEADPVRDAIATARRVAEDPVIQARLRQIEAAEAAETAKAGRALETFQRLVEETVPAESVWDAFREAGMAKIANAALQEHGWMLVFDLDGNTVPMRLPGPPRIARAEDLEAEDVKHLERLAKMGIE